MTAQSQIRRESRKLAIFAQWHLSLRRLCGITVAFGALLLIAAATAPANTPIVSFSALPSTTQAGGHPDVGVSFEVKNRVVQDSHSACDCEDAKDATIHLPDGFIGNPHAAPQCTLAQFSADDCPIDSQLGIVNVVVSGAGVCCFNSAVYNLAPPPDVPGLLGFKIFLFNTPQFTVLSARTDGDYGLDARLTSIYRGIPLQAAQQVLWGVPADPSHNPLRLDSRFNPNGVGFTSYLGGLCDANGVDSTLDPNTVVKPCHIGKALPPTASNSPLTPFLQNPTTCDSALPVSFDVLSYDGGTDHAENTWPEMTGCSQLSFNPSLYAQPTTSSADSPSGIDVNLTIPQQQSPSIPSPAELRAATVTLPPGFSINSNAAEGKTACSDAEAHFGALDAANCPEFSKIGSLEIDSSALPGPLPGFVYLGQPLIGNRYRIFLVADGFATHIKLAGTVTPDPTTGQLVISFQDLPQSPLTAFNMHFFGSERGLLATPTQCGTYSVTTTFTPWTSSIGARTSAQFFTIDTGPDGGPCPDPQRPFTPSFQAASVGNTAGAYTPYSVDLSRKDGDQFLTGLTVTTPPGFSGRLAGIPYCSDPAIARLGDGIYSGVSELSSSVCPPASRIGTVVASAGAGSRPLNVPGKVYLAGPYKGAPLSLLVVIPAVSGPYDLGNVAVRAAIRVDPLTAQVTAVSDPLPEILDGIPLRTRSIRINLDRPEFTLNPTNCDLLSTNATIFGDQGGVSRVGAPYQVANCAALPFAPKLTLRLSGGINRRGHPAIHAVVQASPGEANIHRVSVTLPKGELLDNGHIGTVCTKVQFAQGTCPASSAIGRAEVVTPLLDEPLSGKVYLRSSTHDLPDMALDLHGQFNIEAIGRIDSIASRLRTTFESVPDAPISRITLDLAGGSKGLVVNSVGLCAATKRATVKMTGQNGLAFLQKAKLQSNCGSKGRMKRHLLPTRIAR